eukprot:446125_1
MTVISHKKTKRISTIDPNVCFRAQDRAFQIIYYTIACLQLLTTLVCLAGQTTGIFFYDWAARHGLQESRTEVPHAIVQVNRAFCTSDTIIYIPLMIFSAYGLFRKKRWSLVCTAASAGIHSYWATTAAFIFLFLDKNDVEGYSHHVPVEIWCGIGFYVMYGVLVLEFLCHYWDILFVITSN